MAYRFGPAALSAGFVAFGAAVLFVPACTISAGDGDPDGGDFTGNDSGPKDVQTTPPGDPACNSCVFQGCTAQWAVCNKPGTNCAALYTCATRPSCASDAACIARCFETQTTEGRAKYEALYACNRVSICSSCSATCPALRPATDCSGLPEVNDAGAGGDDGGPIVDDSGTPVPSDGGAVLSCNQCNATNCGTEDQACKSGSECESYRDVVAACANAAAEDVGTCLDAAVAAYPGGKQAADALATCSQSKCNAECGYGG